MATEQEKAEIKNSLQRLEDEVEYVVNDRIVEFIVKNPKLAKIASFALAAAATAIGYFFGSH